MKMTITKELVVDNFAGGGGASTGMEAALGHSVDIAINHDPDAIAMHKANHPDAKHYCEDVWEVDPVEACNGNPVGLAWFSPDCTHFSRAKGGKPKDKNIRGLAWVTVRWALKVRPRCIMLENVPEITTWGPLGEDGQPIKERAGETFDGFLLALTKGIKRDHPAFKEMCDTLKIDYDSEDADKLVKGLGYDLEWNILKSCDYGAPTTRTRFYLIARCDGAPIIWAEPTHADRNSYYAKKGLRKPYRAVAECLDWTIPAQSIFERDKPLAENTLKRIARGIKKFVIDNPEPFIVQYKFENEPQSINDPLSTITTVNSHYVVTPTIMCNNTNNVGSDVESPLPTVTTGNRNYLVAPSIVPIGYGEKAGQAPRVNSVEEPLGTIVASNKHYLSCAHIMKNYGGGYTGSGSAADAPLDTVTAKDHNSLVTAHIMTMRKNMDGQKIDEPLSTVSCSGAHHAEVQAFLIKYFSTGTAKSVSEPIDTITSRDRFALVTIHGEEYVIADIKMRMLTPRELFRAQGFPDDYIIDCNGADGKPYTRTKQVARCGNAVTPPVPAALVRANLPEMCKGA